MRSVLLAASLVSALTLLPALALAHVDLDWPVMASTSQKDGPCGSPAAGAAVHTFRPGSTITVRYTETIGHPGHFRVAMAPTAGDLTPPTDCGDVGTPLEKVGNMTILADGVNLAASANDDIMGCPGRVGTRTPVSNTAFTVDVTFPNEECQGCVLQMIQFMTDKPPLGDAGGNDLYFRCAYINLSNQGEVSTDLGEMNPAPGGDPGTDPGGSDPGTDPGTEPTDPANPNSTNNNLGGGCSAASREAGSVLGISLLLAAVLFLRRRRRIATEG